MFIRVRWPQLLCASVLLLPSTTGCFRSGPELAPVTGTVTLDGKPLVGAQVEFNPMQGNPSYGTTDGAGQYELKYTKDRAGAVIGTHVVRITTQTTAVNAAGEETQVPDPVPERYNYRSELIREVVAGENRIDFALTSQREAEAPGTKEAGAKPEPKEAAAKDSKDSKAQEPDTERANELLTRKRDSR